MWRALATAAMCAACASVPRLPHERAGVDLANPYSPPARARGRLRVVTFNVERGRDVPRLAREIYDDPRLRDADVLLVQEIESHPDEDESRTARLGRALRMNYAYVPARAEGDAGGSHGLAILSRYPLSGVRSIELPRYDMRFNTRRRIAITARIDAGGAAVQLYDVHLDTRISARERIDQLQPVLADAAAQSGAAIVIGGDFNTNAFRWAGRVLPVGRADQAAALDAAMRDAGYGTPTAATGSTQRAPVLGTRVDSIYTRGAATGSAGVARTVTASDHWPVWLDIELAVPGE
jgi:endonuclease/exonuclease/phosphatase family metal-dependent hydrolase